LHKVRENLDRRRKGPILVQCSDCHTISHQSSDLVFNVMGKKELAGWEANSCLWGGGGGFAAEVEKHTTGKSSHKESAKVDKSK